MKKSFENLHRLVKNARKGVIGLVGAAAPEVLRAARMAVEEDTAVPILIGNTNKMREVAAAEHLDLDGIRTEHAKDDPEAAFIAMEMVRNGEAEALLKGRILTRILMKEGYRKGLRRDGRLMSHVTLIEVPRFKKPILVTDSALTPYPTFEQRIQIIKNAVDVMRRLGVEEPRVAILSASEEINDKIPCSLDAARLADLNLPGGELESFGIIEGPLDLGCALDEETARIKGVSTNVAGKVDILVAPDIVSANLLSKSLIYLADGQVAACVVGGNVPIGMVSRASPAKDKYNALLLTMACR